MVRKAKRQLMVAMVLTSVAGSVLALVTWRH
jgi:hypothetical protein